MNIFSVIRNVNAIKYCNAHICSDIGTISIAYIITDVVTNTKANIITNVITIAGTNITTIASPKSKS